MLPAEPVFNSERTLETIHRADGGAETHVVIKCTLGDIAKGTNLRIDDCAFALNECGLLMRRLSGISENEVVVVTREQVEQVGRERNVKIMFLEPPNIIKKPEV